MTGAAAEPDRCLRNARNTVLIAPVLHPHPVGVGMVRDCAKRHDVMSRELPEGPAAMGSPMRHEPAAWRAGSSGDEMP